MKFLHVSDLHLGIKLMDVDLIEDQRFILDEIIKLAVERKVDALLIAGDVYDSTWPRIEATSLLDEFLTKACEKNLQVFMISGNHDQAERLSFGSKIFKNSNIYISEKYSKDQGPIKVSDEYGDINIYMLPFIKPINIKTEFDVEDSMSYDTALKMALDNFKVNYEERNIILSHQFVAGSTVCDSENYSIGGVDQVAGSHYDKFDYVALGHLHNPQIVDKKEYIRYSGSPIKLSFSEVNVDKVAVIIDLKEKGNINVESVNLKPLRDMAVIKGKYNDIIEDKEKIKMYEDTYLKVVLTDEKDEPFAKEKLANKYKCILQVMYERKNTGNVSSIKLEEVNKKPDIDLIKDFFKEQMGREMDEKQIDYIKDVLSNREGKQE